MTEDTPKITQTLLSDKIVKFLLDNGWFIACMLILAIGLYNIGSSLVEHRNQVQELSKQNAACIYLEKSDLGAGQHYMICDGQIVLKRVSDETAETTPEEKLEEVVPTNATATPTPKK